MLHNVFVSFVIATMILLGGSASDASVKIAIAGDSTAQSYGQDVYPGLEGWGQALVLHLTANAALDNRALSGRSSKSFQLEGWWSILLAQRPDYVLIQFGHNDDTGMGKGPDLETLPGPIATPYPASPELGWRNEDWYRWNLTKMVSDCRSIGARPILMAPMERLIWWDGTIVRYNEPYADGAKVVADSLGVPLIDLNTFSVQTYSALGDDASQIYHYHRPDGSLDRTHFSPAGAELYADEIARQLTSVPGIGSYIAVPEPSAVLVLAIPSLALLSRRAGPRGPNR